MRAQDRRGALRTVLKALWTTRMRAGAGRTQVCVASSCPVRCSASCIRMVRRAAETKGLIHIDEDGKVDIDVPVAMWVSPYPTGFSIPRTQVLMQSGTAGL